MAASPMFEQMIYREHRLQNSATNYNQHQLLVWWAVRSNPDGGPTELFSFQPVLTTGVTKAIALCIYI